LVLTAVARVEQEQTILLLFEDVTERKTRDEMLANAERALRDTDRRKNEFLAALAHELRNPLAPIRTSLTLLARHALSDERARKAYGIIDRQVAHLARLVDDLLDVTRINRSKIELQRTHINLADLVRSTVDDHSASFGASGISLEVRLDAGKFGLDADPARLVQVVSNLLSNAEKFTPRGGSVTVTLRREHGSGVLRVSDTGAGIAPETLAHVFEPFAQAPQTIDRARGGLGLGLAMVKGLVELHGGSVGIRSEGEGHGTEVTVFLPLDEEPVDTRPPPPPEPPAHGARRILVIEDNRDAAESLVELLEDTGHEVRLAFDGMTGIQTARAFIPEVVICDIGLPEMTGYDVAKALRGVEALERTYLISLSGYGRTEDQRLAQDAGFDQHLVKPPDIDELYRLIEVGPDEKAHAASAHP
jgi:nitrogen-specific signal transduction histidine kinase/ActR/RegA family two-component response regulator